MRLHRLELQAFGPYAQPQQIDFDQLSRSGLFLLEGPTGAGKTTILDAITFALYGGLAGQDSADDRLHSDFADPDIEPLVRLEFSVNGVRHEVTRVPEHQRRKRRGSGFTTEAMRVHLRRSQAGRWVTVSANKAEAGEAITTAVGLNRVQFTQVMLLPQGEFARFLRADDDARRALLTKLFGTELYDRVTAELDRRRAEAMRARQAAHDQVANAVSAAAEAAGLDAELRQELIAADSGERTVRFKQVSDELADLASVTTDAALLAATETARAQAAEQDATRQAALLARLARARAELSEHEAGRPEHDQRVVVLTAARRAEPVRPLLAAVADAEAAVTKARRALRDQLDPAEPGLTGLIGTSVDSALARSSAQRAAARATASQREAASLAEIFADEAKLPERETDTAALSQVAAQACERVAAIEATRRDLPERLAAAESGLGQARALAAGLDAARQQQADVARALAAAEQLAESEPVLVQRASALRAATDEHQRLVDEHQQAMEARLAGIAAELARELAAGVACPVCGSAEHPSPAQESAEPVTAEAVADASDRRDAAQRRRSAVERAHADLDHEVAGLAAVTAGRSLAELAGAQAGLARRLVIAQQAADSVGRLGSELTGLRADQERIAGEYVEAVAARAAADAEAERASADLAALRAALAAAAAPYPSVAARKAALEAAAEADSKRATVLGDLAAALDLAEQARGRAEDEAVASGFGAAAAEVSAGVSTAIDGMLPLDVGGGAQALAAARAAVLRLDRQAALDAQVTSWAATHAELLAAVSAPELAGLDPDQADDAAARAETAVAALDLAREAEQEARSASHVLRARADRLAARLAEVESAGAAAAALAADTEPVIYLAGLAKGMEGHRRVALTTYVLRHWFEQVVAAANIRLAAMSSGRYELRRSDEAQSRRQRAGLTLTVIDRYTGEERSPASLSGGETFYTSLALALGLADVVKSEAGGVDLQTLFIDEGFGSLDEHTMDQVLGVIDELRDRGRAVGIVSHVAELKDRVTERLEVRRLPDGSSVAKVVA
jgi:exonuclease SbcC